MEFARAAVIEHAISGVTVLLDFKQDGAGPDGVDGSCIDEDHVAGMDIEHGEILLERARTNTVADAVERGAGAKTQGKLCAGFGSKSIPTLGFSARLALEACKRVVRVHLHTELLAGKDDFDEQRRRGFMSGSSPKHGFGILPEDLGEGFACVRTGVDEAVITGEPDFADGLGFRWMVVPGTQI